MSKSYRDLLVQQIKDVGQELIDRAETIIPEGLTPISNFYMYINYPQFGVPTIQCTTEVLSTGSLKDFQYEDRNK